MKDVKLPEGWKSELLQNITNQIIDGTHHTPVYLENGIPFLRVTDIQKNYIDKKNIKYISLTTHKALAKRCNPEFSDILYSKNGTIGISKIVNWHWEFSIFVSLCLLKIKQNEILPQFLLNYLCSEHIKRQIHKRAKQGTVTNLHLEEIREFIIYYPQSLPEQKKIAEILTTIDNTIEKTEQLIEKLKNIKKGLMHDLFTRGVDGNGRLRPPYEEAPQLYKESGLGWIPKEWEVETIESLSKKVGSGITPRGGEEVYKNEGIMLLRSQNIHFNKLTLENVAFIDEKTNNSMLNSELCSHDILLNITGASIGRCCYFPDKMPKANVNQHVCSIRLKKANYYNSKVLTYYLCSYFGQNQINRFNAGGNREGLNYYQLKSFKIKWFRDAIERKKSVDVLESNNLAIINEENKLQKLQNLKQGLLEDLLTGKVRVTSLLKKDTP